MLLTKTVKVKPYNKMVKYYKDLGYKIEKAGQEIEVNVWDLPDKSHVSVKVKCDYGGEEYETMWYLFLRGRKDIDKDACFDCRHIKEKEIGLLKYGTENFLNLPEFREKAIQTKIERYGTSKNMDIPGVKEKIQKTCLERYGETNPNKNEKVKEKGKQTCLERYGDTNVLGRNSSLREEIHLKEVEAKQGVGHGIRVSKNQLYLADLYGGQVNIQIGKYYWADIYFPETGVYCEYDGSGHDLQVQLGNITQEELDRREEKRYFSIKAEGYKLFKIKNINRYEKLPSDEILLQMKQLAFDYLKEDSNNWIVFDLVEHLIITKNDTFKWDYKSSFHEIL